MNEIGRRKLNLLLHLARVDGKFVNSERRLLQQFIEEMGLADSSLDDDKGPIDFNVLTDGTEAKIELLYWALKLVQVDQVIDENEISFCNKLARKLTFKEEIVSHFVHDPLPEYKSFVKEVRSFWITGL